MVYYYVHFAFTCNKSSINRLYRRNLAGNWQKMVFSQIRNRSSVTDEFAQHRYDSPEKNMRTKTDIQEHRKNFPGLTNKAYFNYGGQGVMSSQALAAILDSFKNVQSTGPFNSKMFGWLTDEVIATKKSLASEFGGDVDLYALTQNATEGCNIVLWGLEWKTGDHLLLTDSEHFGVLASSQQLARRHNLELSYFSAAGPTQTVLNNLEQALKSQTKLVVVSHVLWNTGAILPIAEMSEICRKRSTLLLVDGAQSAGVIPLDLAKLDVDFYALTGHKWLGGPEGVGALYVSAGPLSK